MKGLKMEIDIRTLVFILGITHLIQVAVFYLQYKLKKDYQGVGWWLMWSIAEVVGFSGVLLRDIPSMHLFAITIQNTSIFLGTIFIYIGLMQFGDKKINERIIFSVSAAFIIVISYFVYVHDDLFMRAIIFNGAIASTSFFTAYALLSYKMPTINRITQFNACIFLLHGGVFSYRTFYFLISKPNSDFFVPTLFNYIPYIDALVVSLLWTFGFIIMVNQRLNSESIKDKENLELIFNTTPDAVMITRLEDGYFVKINEKFRIFSGYAWSEVVGKSIMELNIWKHPADRQKIVNMLNEKGFCENQEISFLRKDGSTLYGLLNAKRFTLQDIPHIISVVRDITAYKKAEEERQMAARQFQAILSTLYGGLLVISTDSKVEYANQSLCNLFDLKVSPESLVGMPVSEIMPIIISLYEDQTYAISRIKQLVHDEQPMKDEEVAVIGNRTYMLDYIPIIIDGKDHGRIWHHRDITEQKRAEEKLREISIRDPLTDVFNRRYAFERMDEILAAYKRNAINFSIAIIDLDYFKKVNDIHGHQAGDFILIEIANTIKSNIRPYDILGRYGGEEFIIIFTDSDKTLVKTKLEAVLKIVREKKFFYKQNEIRITFSGGVSDSRDFDEKEISVDKIIETADQRLYEAKTAGRNRIAI
jgi:diguanylate cyclase (GGDEF)-like protein/PAS domain S-box-containing protein